VTDKEIDARIDQVKKQSFGGSQAKLDKQLKEQGYTKESLRADIKAQLLSEKIYDAVTKDAKVTDADIAKYYEQNKSQYSQAESRDVRHILVKTKAQADKIYDMIKAGGNFAALAKALPVFGELRNCMDLSVAAALFVKEDLPTAANCDLSLLLDEKRLPVAEYQVAKTIDSRASLIRCQLDDPAVGDYLAAGLGDEHLTQIIGNVRGELLAKVTRLHPKDTHGKLDSG